MMCGYFCIRSTNVLVINKTLAEFTNLFSPSKLKKQQNKTWIFQIMYEWKKSILLNVISIKI